MKVVVNIHIAPADARRDPLGHLLEPGVLYEQTFKWDAIPRVDDSFLLSDEGGWSEDVKHVWWSATGEVIVELGTVADIHDEDLAGTLRANHWHTA